MTTQSSGTSEPETPILGDYKCAGTYCKWKIVYNAVLVAVVVVAGLILVMVSADIIHEGDEDTQDDWGEVSNQIMNGVFTLLAVTDQPAYVSGVIMTSQVLKASNVHLDEQLEASIRAARHLNNRFPRVFADSTVVRDNEAEYVEVQCDYSEDVDANPQDNLVGRVGNIVFLCREAKYLRNTYIVLNCGCFLQYILSGFMWSYDKDSRPGFVTPGLLPPVILCFAVGVYRLFQLNKSREVDTVGCSASSGKVQSTTNSLVSPTAL
ncbi:hypothetical protein V7S43_003139 [Phytophthora oleae]|uniref:Uncharacterized protein n=1 Tax=Phytophthora oleae TaxID=2107226 RepID=A0ABD3FW99_9STRA